MKKRLFVVCMAVISALCMCVGVAGCGGKEEAAIDEHSHYFSTSVVGPTCTAQGYTLHYCVCGYSYKDNYTDLTSHNYRTNVVAPTCTAQGYTVHTCSKCNNSYKDTYTDAAGHSYTEYVSDNNATCSANATETAICQNGCGKYDTREVPDSISPDEHVYEDNVCKYCRSALLHSEGLRFELNEAGTEYAITGMGDCTDTALIIPQAHDSLPVTRIAKNAFKNCSSITSVYITNSVTTIEEEAFRNCSSITSLRMTNSVTSIGNYAFRGCTGLTSVTIPSGVTTIGDSAFYGCTGLVSVTIPRAVTSLGKSVFTNCFGLTGLAVQNGNNKYHSENNCIIETESKTLVAGCKTSVIPDDKSVTTIGENAFRGCTGLAAVTIPDSVTSIGRRAFADCIGLVSVTIGSKVASISNYAFENCPKLVEVYNRSGIEITQNSEDNGEVGYYAKNIYSPDSGESKLHNVNDYIFYADGDTVYLMGYAGAQTQLTLPENYNNNSYKLYTYALGYCKNVTSITVPGGITAIPAHAFAYSAELKTVVLPGSVSTIGRDAFLKCTGLERITIPDGVTTIYAEAFWGCSSLSTIKIANTVTIIGSSALFECSALTDINFDGTQEEWNAITKGGGWDSYTTEYTVHCKDGDIQKQS